MRLTHLWLDYPNQLLRNDPILLSELLQIPSGSSPSLAGDPRRKSSTSSSPGKQTPASTAKSKLTKSVIPGPTTMVTPAVTPSPKASVSHTGAAASISESSTSQPQQVTPKAPTTVSAAPASATPPTTAHAAKPSPVVPPTPSAVTSPQPPRASISIASPVLPTGLPSTDGKHSPDTQLELTNLRAEIQTLTDQVDALKAKREEDRVRLQEIERLKIQITQMEENRRLMREQAAELQRTLAQAKTVTTQNSFQVYLLIRFHFQGHSPVSFCIQNVSPHSFPACPHCFLSRQEKAELQEAFDRYREETAEMVENMEMATLDKEMAEEKLDSVQSELELLKEQVEELTLENQILKEESEERAAGATTGEETAGEGVPTSVQLKNLEQQNERMKQALVKLRDLANQDKQEISKLTKEIGSLESEVNQLSTEKERLSTELKQSLEQVIELKEQVDASLGADQMVAQLTQRNLELEEQIEKLTEARNILVRGANCAFPILCLKLICLCLGGGGYSPRFLNVI
ncbi:unnamed protein product [Echinostoma caproni]|uniref:Uncharacterized protein n=1 Tax=Echinostoma caproni TaxID=27848 RepID=A0A3P8LBH4_9TREM|nr:unnamed protein product [Echinostoma caproni]